MKKISFWSLLFIFVLALQGCGGKKDSSSAELPIGYVYVTADNVSLYMAPNEDSPKLFTVVDEGNFDCLNYTWYKEGETRTTDVGYNEPCLANKGSILEVMEESGDWLFIRKSADHNPYIQKKYTRSLTPMDITDELVKEIGWIHVVPSGKYKDYCWYFEEMNCMYFVGKVEGCRFVFTKFIEPSLESAENVDGGFKIEQKPGYLPVVYYNENLKADDEFMTYMDLNKLSEEQFEKFLGAMDDCSESPKVTVFFDEFDQYGNRLSFYGM